MIKTINASALSTTLKRNWFKVSLGVLLLFLFVKKDFTLQFNLNSPDYPDVPAKQVRPMEKKNRDKPAALTDAQPSTTPPNTKLSLLSLGTSSPAPKANPLDKLAQVDEAKQLAYLKRFAQVAISERKKFGVPSSVVLANALIHSLAGTRDMAKAPTSNNHFAIPCTTNWSGSTATYQDACYRQYENAWMSFRNHSEYITSGNYANLKQLGTSDYKAWAKALEQKGFSDFGQLASAIVVIIEKYNLHELDQK